MKIGFLTGYSKEIVAFARQAGFGSLELSANPGSSFDPQKLTARELGAIQQTLDDAGIEVSAVGSYFNHLDPDPEKRRFWAKHFTALMDLAVKMGVGVVCTFAGRVPNCDIPDSIPEFRKVFSKHAKRAEDKGLKIAFENCPMFSRWPFYGNNIAYKPEAFDLMFDAVDSPALGLEYDPSHFYWLHIDYIDMIQRYGERIYHVHAKDTEIMYDRFAEEGIYGKGWWRYRIPGWGEVDWQKVFMTLNDVGYTGNLDIEHEDPVFHGDRHHEGLVLGLKHLQQFVA